MKLKLTQILNSKNVVVGFLFLRAVKSSEKRKKAELKHVYGVILY